MKILVTLFIMFILPVVRINTNVDKPIKEYTETGYDQFKKLIPTDEEVKILHNMDDEFIEDELAQLKRRFFGSSNKTFNEYADGKYISETIFSRSNKTRDSISFVYDTSTVKYKAISITVKGSISAKAAYKGKQGEIGISGEKSLSATGELNQKDTTANKFTVVICPGKKIIFRVAGDCKISNGVRKYYVMGVRVSKGAWEVVNITSACCELVEEDA